MGGKSKTSSKKYIYSAGALEKAKYEISGTTLSSKLKFVETKNAYDYHFFYEEDNIHEINGINYALIPEESIAIVHAKDEGYKGAVKIPSTITYQKKKYVVTEIGKMAFLSNHELTSLTLSASICFISDFVIEDCGKLTKIRVESTTPAYVESHGFQEFNTEDCTLTVPLGSVDIYKKAFGWEQFENIKAFWNKAIFEEINRKLLEISRKEKAKIKDLPRRKNSA